MGAWIFKMAHSIHIEWPATVIKKQGTLNRHMSYSFGNNIYTFSSVPLMYSWFGRHISFSLFMSINFNITHIYVSVHNTNAYLVLSDSHSYFHLAAIFVLLHLWSLMYSMIGRHIARNFILCACIYIYIYIYIYAHLYIHSCSSAFIHPSIQINVCLHTCIYIHV